MWVEDGEAGIENEMGQWGHDSGDSTLSQGLH